MRFLLFSIDNANKLRVFDRNAARFARSIAGDPQALRAWGSPFRNRGLVVGVGGMVLKKYHVFGFHKDVIRLLYIVGGDAKSEYWSEFYGDRLIMFHFYYYFENNSLLLGRGKFWGCYQAFF